MFALSIVYIKSTPRSSFCLHVLFLFVTKKTRRKLPFWSFIISLIQHSVFFSKYYISRFSSLLLLILLCAFLFSSL
jgi:hypothetical protein